MSKNIILSTIYKLVFKHNTNIAYVGQSTNINSRFKKHIKNAKDFSNIDNKLYFFMVFIIFILKSLIIYLTLIYIILVSSFIYLFLFTYLYDLKPLFYIKNLNSKSKIKLFQIYISMKIILRCLTFYFY